MSEDTEDSAGFDPHEAAALCGLSAKQLAFAEALRLGATKTGAARKAGYKGDDASLRSAGSRAAASHKVRRYLDMAAMLGAGAPDEPPVNPGELKRIISQLCRSSDGNMRTQALSLMHKIHEKEDAERAEAERLCDPVTTLQDIARIDALLAVKLADDYGINFVPDGWPNIPRCPHCRQALPQSKREAAA